MKRRSAESFGSALNSASARSCVAWSYSFMRRQMILTTTSELSGSQAVSNSIIGRARHVLHRIDRLQRFDIDFVGGFEPAPTALLLGGLIGVEAIQQQLGEGAEQQ